MAAYLPGSYKLSRSKAAAQAYMELNSGLNDFLSPQAQYAKASQAHQVGLNMQQAPDIAYESTNKKRKGLTI